MEEPSTSTSRAYRLQAKQLFLTYAQCPIAKGQVLSQLRERLDIDKYLIAEELHQDGNKHVHVYLKLQAKCDIRDPASLDLVSDEESGRSPYHGNYQGCRSPQAVMRYCLKEEDYITNLPPELVTKLAISAQKSEYLRARKIALTGNVNAAIAEIAKTPRGARDLALHEDVIRKNLRGLCPRKTPVTYTMEDFPGWSVTWNRRLTLVLTGKSNTGKTALAKALLPGALLVTHMDQLRHYDADSSTGIVLDEGSFKHIPREAQIHLIDVSEDRYVHCRYAPGFLPAGTSRVITSNLRPSDVLEWDRYEIRRRCQWVEVKGLNDYVDHGSPTSEEEHVRELVRTAVAYRHHE